MSDLSGAGGGGGRGGAGESSGAGDAGRCGRTGGMSPERWQRIAGILDGVYDVPESGRDAFLDEACNGDESLRREVDSLLRMEEAASGLLDTPAVELLAGSEAALPEEAASAALPGARFGPWRVTREIGRGGMAVVALAERADGQFEQRVALKILHPGFFSPGLISRFLRERQILARLEHDNIARLLDGGTTGDGLPWIAMEYVEGTPIDAYCDTEHLGIKRRLELFHQVCDAVQYAHENLVVHRDLKPSNILVTAEGQVKLLDFGIAKLLDETASDTTRPVERLMTPSYASPEQITGNPVTTASDVYALGLILYELLTGHRARMIDSSEPLAVRRAVLETDPERPSRAVVLAVGVRHGDGSSLPATTEEIGRARGSTGPQLRRLLVGDLDAIVMKALAKEPEQRYPTVAALGQDIDAHLDSMPVAARRGNTAYRLRKFVRRHRLQVAAGLVVALSLSGGLVAAAAQARVAARERDQARTAETKAAAINDFLVNELLTAPSPERARGNPLTVAEVLDIASRNVGHAFPEQPALEASLRLTLAGTYSSLGDYRSAREHATAGLDLLKAGRTGNDRDLLRARAFLAEIAADEGRYAEARTELEEVESLQTVTAGPDDPDTLGTRIVLGRVLNTLGEYATAERILSETLGVLRASHPDLWRPSVRAGNTLADSLLRQMKLLEAETVCREALDTSRARAGADHPETISTLHRLAVVLQKQDRLEEAEQAYRQVLDQRQRILGEDHPDTADALADLGVLYDRQNRYDDSINYTARAQEIYSRVLGPEHPKTVRMLSNLGIALRLNGHPEKAAPIYRRVYESYRRSLGEDAPQTIRAARNLNIVLVELGRLVEARTVATGVSAAYERIIRSPDADPTILNDYASYLLSVDPVDARDPRRALEVSRRAAIETDRTRFEILDTFARALDQTGDVDGALEIAREAWSLPEGADSTNLEQLLVSLLENKKDNEGQESFLRETLDRRENRQPPDGRLIAQTRYLLGRHFMSGARPAEAEESFGQALARLRETLPDTDWRIGRAKSCLGESLAAQGRYDEAEPLVTEGYRTLVADPRVWPSTIEDARARVVSLYKAWGRLTEAERWRSRTTR